MKDSRHKHYPSYEESSTVQPCSSVNGKKVTTTERKTKRKPALLFFFDRPNFDGCGLAITVQ